jgi:TonB family protein
MNLLSDTQGIASGFGDYIEDLRDVFRCNGVDFGLPEDFFAFARTMKYHSDLHWDVARVAKAVTEKEANVSLRTILTIIAVASGGAEIATSDSEMSIPINLVAESLIRDGVCSPLHVDDPDSPCSNLVANPPEQISPSVVTRDAGLQVGSLDTLTASLTRLELSSLQLQVYLDSIDQQIDRIEPGLTIVPAPLSPDDSSENARNYPSQSEERDRAAIGVRRDFRLFSFALPILIGVCSLLLAATFLFWMFRRGADYAVVRSPEPALEGGGVNAGGSSVAPAVNGASAVPARGARAGGSRPTDRSPRSSKKSAQIALRSPSATKDSETPPVAPTDTSDVSGGPDRVPDLNHPVDVSSGVMAANLVSAPKPSYPAFASLTRTQGSVVMRAVISKDGSVEHVQVIQGHRLLRGAAKSAVRNWRYRPYKINGVPVDVATTVSVDFSLHH